MASKQTRSLECPVCLEEYVDPRILPCYHTLCRRCLGTQVTTSATRGQYSCPVCRASHKVPANGIDGIQKNFYINEMQEMAKAMKPKHPMCKDHPTEDLRFYCLNCELPICRDCKVVGHERHKIDFVSEVVKVKKAEAQKLIEAAEYRKQELKRQFAKYRDRLMDQHISKAESILKETVEKMEHLESRLSKMLEYIKGDIEKWKSDCSDAFKSNRDLHDEAKNNLNLLIEQLSEISQEPIDAASDIKCYNRLLKKHSRWNENSNVIFDAAIPTSSTSFMECFNKFMFQANLEVYKFENKLYKKIRHVFTYPTESSEMKNYSNKEGRRNSSRAKEDQPGPSGEPSRKKRRADGARRRSTTSSSDEWVEWVDDSSDSGD